MEGGFGLHIAVEKQGIFVCFPAQIIRDAPYLYCQDIIRIFEEQLHQAFIAAGLALVIHISILAMKKIESCQVKTLDNSKKSCIIFVVSSEEA